MAQQFAVGQVHPDAGIVVERGTGDQEKVIAWLHPRDMGGALAEDGTMDRGPEAFRPFGGERW